jgi:hypothetical protein
VPALFGAFKLLQYLHGDFPMPLLIRVHVQRVPIGVVQIDLDREHIGSQRSAIQCRDKATGADDKNLLVIQFRERGQNGQKCLDVFDFLSGRPAFQRVISQQWEVMQPQHVQENRNRIIHHHVEGL